MAHLEALGGDVVGRLAVQRRLSRDALADPRAKRPMTILGIDVVMGVGLLAAVGSIERLAVASAL